MDFNKNSLSKLLSLSDEELIKVIKEIAAGSGVDTGSLSISKSDVSKIRTVLSLASDEEISQLVKQFGGKRQ